MPYQSPSPDYFQAYEKITHSSHPVAKTRTPGSSLSFPLTADGGRHDRVRDHRQPPWQQTLPKGRRSSRLGLPGKLQVIAADCNPGKPHPALSALGGRKIRRSAWMGAMYVHAHDTPIASRRDEKVGWDPPAAAAGTGLKADYRVPRYADYIRRAHSICECMLRSEAIMRVTLHCHYKYLSCVLSWP